MGRGRDVLCHAARQDILEFFARGLATWAYGNFIPLTLKLFGNRDFDKANWLNLGQALGRERVDQ